MTPKWLRDSVDAGRPLACEDFVVVRDLQVSTVENCPNCSSEHCVCSDSTTTQASAPSSSKFRLSLSDIRPTSPIYSSDPPTYLLPPSPPLDTNLEKLEYTSRYACRRASPSICLNQDLVRELNIIRQSRSLEGEERSALSYERAASVIKGTLERADSRVH